METANEVATQIVTKDQLLEHWQGHRRLTRRIIEAIPEDKLFSYSIGSMRPFGALALEMIGMAIPGMPGLVDGSWGDLEKEKATTKDELLALWDKATDVINEYWPKITAERFQETVVAFGQWENTVFTTLMYFIDNEIHHRGQGYVYLRSLNIAPVPFWER